MTLKIPRIVSSRMDCLGRARRFFFLRRPGLTLAVLAVAFFLVASIAPSLLAPGDPLDAGDRQAFLAPGGIHMLGTDEQGRDVWTRLVHGARISLVLALASTAFAVAGGFALGVAAGLGPRWLDRSLARAIDGWLAFPNVVLALVIAVFFGSNASNIILALGLGGAPFYARLVRAQVRLIRRAPYVEAARTLGLREINIIWRHILPNAAQPILSLGFLGVGTNIAAAAGLSFLGLGVPPPAPEWGAMLATGRSFLSNAWWLSAIPGSVVLLVVIAFTTVGQELLRRTERRSH